MQGRIVLWIGLIALAVLGPLAQAVSASGMLPRYQLVDLGPVGNLPNSSYPEISNDGVFSTWMGVAGTVGQYSEGLTFDKQQPWLIDANSLRKDGSDTNLLPADLASPLTAIHGISLNGEVVGADNQGGFYFNSRTGQIIHTKTVPNLPFAAIPLGINALHQMVGFQDGSTPLYYPDPSAAPVNVNSLVVNLGNWDLGIASSINDSGQIVGVGYRGTSADYRYFRLDPLPVPEPAAWIAFAAVGLLAVTRGRGANGRRTR